MSSLNCESCDNLRETSPEYALNGTTTAICNSLKNNTGLNPSLSVLHENEEDLHDINDCTVGRLAQEIEGYDVCQWKDYMKTLVPNQYELLKAMICSQGGLWTNVEKMWCWLEHLATNPVSRSIHAYEDDDPEKPAINGFRIVDGVRMRPTGPNNAPIAVTSLGNVLRVNGSLDFYGNMPTDYTNGASVAWSSLQHGSPELRTIANERWGKDGICNTQPLVWEIQISDCDLGFTRFFETGVLHQSSAGDFTMHVFLFKKGDRVPPDYSNGAIGLDEKGQIYNEGMYIFNPTDSKKMLLQVRLQSTRVPMDWVSPNGTIHVIPCPDSWEC